jgi:hypothetical protein
MKQHCKNVRNVPLSGWLLIFMLFVVAIPLVAEAPAAAASAFNAYVNAIESRLAQQHRSQNGFIASIGLDSESDKRLRKGALIIEELTPPDAGDFSGAMLHHWRGTAFAPRATAADFERVMEDFNTYPQRFSPEVVQAKVVKRQDDHGQDQFRVSMRMRQKHVITVVMDATFDIHFVKLDAQHGYSISRSTEIAEIDSPGSSSERKLNSEQEHGFLWRMNSYWSYEERDGGLYLQIESVTLSRSIPVGLAWAIRPFVETVPRESLEFTLRSACNGLRK